VGVVGWLPSDADGFKGIDNAVAAAASRGKTKAKTAPPIWFLSSADDRIMHPGFVAQSLLRARQLSGFRHQKVNGLGHNVGVLEGRFMRDFFVASASEKATAAVSGTLKRKASLRARSTTRRMRKLRSLTQQKAVHKSGHRSCGHLRKANQ